MGLDVELRGMIWRRGERYGAMKPDMGLWEGLWAESYEAGYGSVGQDMG